MVKSLLNFYKWWKLSSIEIFLSLTKFLSNFLIFAKQLSEKWYIIIWKCTNYQVKHLFLCLKAMFFFSLNFPFYAFCTGLFVFILKCFVGVPYNVNCSFWYGLLSIFLINVWEFNIWKPVARPVLFPWPGELVSSLFSCSHQVLLDWLL